MPPLVTAGTALGRVSADAALGRLTGAVLTVAGHDHQAAAIGADAAGVGDELDSCGTAEALVRTVVPGLDRDVVARPRGRGYHRRLARRGRPLVPARRDAGRPGAAANPGDAGSSPRRTRTGRCPRGVQPVGSGQRPGIRQDRHPRHRRRREPGAGVAGRAGDGHRPGRRDPRRDDGRVSGPHRTFVVTGGWSRSQALIAVKRRRFGANSCAPSQRGRCPRCRAAGRPRRRRRLCGRVPACLPPPGAGRNPIDPSPTVGTRASPAGQDMPKRGVAFATAPVLREAAHGPCNTETTRIPYADQRKQHLLEALRRDGRIDAVDIAPNWASPARRSARISSRWNARGCCAACTAARCRCNLLLRARGGRPEPSSPRRRCASPQAALAHLPDQGAVLIDAGSTTAQLVELFPGDRELTVYTNTLVLALHC